MRTSAIAWALIAAVFLSRAALVIRAGSMPPALDSAQFDDLARNIAAGRGLAYSPRFQLPWQAEVPPTYKPTARPHVGYAVPLGALYWAGLGPQAMLWLQVLMAALTAWATYRLALLLGLGERASSLLLALHLVYPPFWTYVPILASETQHGMLLVLGLLWLALGVRDRRLGWFAASGIALGLASLTRPATTLLPLAIAPFLLAWERRSLNGWLVLVLTFALAMAPWGIRNQIVFGRFELGTSGKGWNLFVGTYPPTHGRAELPVEEREPWMLEPAVGLDEFGADSVDMALARRNLRRPLGELARLEVEKLVCFWFRVRFDRGFPIPTAKSLAVQGPLLALGLPGLWLLARRRTRLAWLPGLLVLYLTGVHLASLSALRFNLTAMMFVLMGVAVALDAMLERARGRSTEAEPAR